MNQEKIEELWDVYSQLIGSDISDLEYYAGKTVITESGFKKALAALCGEAEREVWVETEDESEYYVTRAGSYKILSNVKRITIPSTASLESENQRLREALESLLNEIDRRGYRNDFTKQRELLKKADSLNTKNSENG